MSGHSHAKTVKRVKDANDQKRGKIFSKISRMISVAAKEGVDPNVNTKLRQAFDEAKKVNMPKENVERAIKRGTGEDASEQLEEVLYEALGPEGVSLIIEGITDNKNRALTETRVLLQKYGFKMANEGSVRWAFEPRGILILGWKKDRGPKEKEAAELAAIEAGAEDLEWFEEEGEGCLEILTKPSELEQIKKILEEKGFLIERSALGWKAKDKIAPSVKVKDIMEKLAEEIADSETIQEFYSNL